MTQRINKSSRFILLFMVACMQTFAQSPGDAFKKMATVPLQSAQAASISKYIEFPVSYYNGLAQISFPIYEVAAGDISVPISLGYHGGGIKVQEEASWVGLGWTLNAGGVITHDIKGSDDDYGFNHQLNKVFPDNQGNAYRGPYSMAKGTTCNNVVYTKDGIPYDCNNLYSQLNGGNVDGEPDMYGYNFGAYSGKFFSGDGQFVDLSNNNIQFTQQIGIGFTAVTPDGYTYTFNALEKAWSYPTPYATITAYYLTKIVSPKGKVVTFQYKSFKTMIDEHDLPGQVPWRNQFPNLGITWGNDGTVMQLPALTEYYVAYKFVEGYITLSAPSEAAGLHQTYSSTTSTNLYLDKILFDNGFIYFEKSPRSDVYGVKLDAVKIYRSNGSLVKSIPFSYSYFISNTGDDDLYNRSKVGLHLNSYQGIVDYYPQSYRNQRLKLLSATIEASQHSFEYYEGDQYTTLPYKSSFNQDFWGYYNGRKNNTSLIPDYALYSLQTGIPAELSNWRGGNRNPDDNYIRAGLLKRITFPTGGYSHFTYEMNQFDNLSQQQQILYQPAKYGGLDAGAGTKKFYFTLTGETRCDISGALYCNGMQDMNLPSYNCNCFCSGQNPSALYAAIEKVDPVTHATLQRYVNWEFEIFNNSIKNAGGYIDLPNQLFSAGTYCITVNYPDNHTPGDVIYNRKAELYVSFYERVPNQSNSSAAGAGLRVSSIKSFDPVTLQTLERQFTYTGGKMMRYPIFYASTFQQYSQPALTYVNRNTNYIHYYLYSTPAMPYSFSANGNYGGYDLVTESLVGSLPVGKTHYAYNNIPDIVNGAPGTYLPGVPSHGYLDNGFLKRITVFDKNNILVKETINDPVITNPKTYWAFRGRLPCETVDFYHFTQYYQFSFYPVQVGKLLTGRTTVIDYANGSSMSTIKDFSYSAKGLLRQENSKASDGSVLSTNYTYAGDYTGVNTGWIKDFKDRNMIGVPLEVYTKINGLVTGGSFTTYLNHDNIITPDKIYKIETTSAKNIASTVPNAAMPLELKLSGSITYDANGNLNQSRAENDVYTSYLWGYNKTYPVAQVTGADYAAIRTLINNGTVSQPVLDNPYSTEDQVKQQLTNLRTALAGSKALLTTYTHNPLVGITSQTDANGLTTYYNYDGYNRLATIRDHQNNILKAYNYYYSPTLKNIVNNLYYNIATTKIFSKLCSPDQYGRTQIGTDVPYSVRAEKYAGLTQPEANAKAQAEIDANGQNNANTMGGCYIYAGPLNLVSVQNGVNANVNINYKCPFNVDFLYLFIQDVPTGTHQNNGVPIYLSKGQTNFTTTLTKGKEYKFSLQAGGLNYPGGNIISQYITIFLP